MLLWVLAILTARVPVQMTGKRKQKKARWAIEAIEAER